MMGDLITVYVKSPSIPAQGVLGDYIDRCITIVAMDYFQIGHAYGLQCFSEPSSWLRKQLKERLD